MATYTPVRKNFIYPTITETDRSFGATLAGPILREDGDWRSYLPPTELQNVGGVESSACYIEAQQHALATIKEEEFGVVDDNYSARFNALLSNGTHTLDSNGGLTAASHAFGSSGINGQRIMITIVLKEGGGVGAGGEQIINVWEE